MEFRFLLRLIVAVKLRTGERISSKVSMNSGWLIPKLCYYPYIQVDVSDRRNKYVANNAHLDSRVKNIKLICNFVEACTTMEPAIKSGWDPTSESVMEGFL